MSACRWRSPSPSRGLRVAHLRRRRRRPSTRSRAASCRSTSPARRRCSAGPGRRAGCARPPTARRSAAPRTSSSSSAPRSTSTSTPTRRRSRGRCEAGATHFRDGQLLVLRSTVYPGVTGGVEQLVADPGLDVDVAFCPERIAEGKAMEELFDAAPDRLGPHRRAPRAGRGAVPAPHRQHRRARAGGGRAGQAVHEHLALHQVRRGQPVLHDRQRPRPRLRADPQGARPRLPARRRHARRRVRRRARACSRTPCSWRRSTTTTSPSATRRCSSTRACRSTWSPAWSSSFDLDTMTVGILGMAFKGECDDIRSSLSYKLSGSCGSRPARCSAPTRTSRSTRPVPLERCSSESDVLIVGAPHRRTATSGTDKPVVDVWNLLGNGARTRMSLARLRRHPGLQRGRRDRPRASTGSSRRVELRLRGPRRRRLRRRTRRCRCSSSTPSTSRGCTTLVNTYGRGPAHAIRYGIDHATPRSSWSRWPTAATTRARSTTLARLVERGVVVAAASRYMRRRPAGRRPAGQGRCCPRPPGARSTARPGRHPRRHQLLQGLLDRLRPRGRHRQPTRASRSASS